MPTWPASGLRDRISGSARFALLLLGFGLGAWTLSPQDGISYLTDPGQQHRSGRPPLITQYSLSAIKMPHAYVLQIQRDQTGGGYRYPGFARRRLASAYDAATHSTLEALGCGVVCPNSSAGPDWVFAVRLPIWIIMLFSSMPFVLWLSRRAGVMGRRKQHLCAACGYDLRATTGRCPECGLAVPEA